MHGAFNWIHPFTPIQHPATFVLALLVSTILFVAVMTALHQLSPQAKKWMTIICTFIAGLFFTLEFAIPGTIPDPSSGGKQNFITPWIDPVSNFIMYAGAWTLGMGIISLSIVHGKRLLKRTPGWHNSLAFFISMIGIIVVGSLTSIGEKGAPWAKMTYDSLYSGLLINLDSAMFALLAFYIASAAYRAFRIRTVEAALLMIAALIVMLGLVDFGIWLMHWIPDSSFFSFLRLERLSQFILSWVNMPAYRAVIIGVSVGALAMALRLWLSLERGSFFSQE
ncbi:MAG TPA: hypothetical protein VHV83_12945 [Armatimonadota bacterium]|nr:hypothetical protein [Armatimonadota bacterium]